MPTFNQPVTREWFLPSWSPIPLLFVCLASLLSVLVLLNDYRSDKARTFGLAKQELQVATRQAAEEINTILEQTMRAAEEVAQGLTTGAITRQNMQPTLEKILANNPRFYGASIAFRPFGFQSDRRLYSAYYAKSGKDAALEFHHIEDTYDYTLPQYDWYAVPMVKGSGWVEPYWGEAGRAYMTTYSAVFYTHDKETGERLAQGVVAIDISMSEIRRLIENLEIGPSGFSALTTREGNYLYHPNYDYVLAKKNIRDVAKEKRDDDRLLIAHASANLESGILDHVSTTTGQASWLIFEPVTISGWSLQNTFIKEDIAIDVDRKRHQLFWMLLASMISAISLSALILRIHRKNFSRLWWFTGVASSVLVVGIGIVWHLALSFDSRDQVEGSKVADKGTLQAMMSEYQNMNANKHIAPPVFVATGLQIEAMEFSSAIDVVVSGLVWQKYAQDLPESIKRGLQFAHAKGVRLTETNRLVQNGYELIQWRFQGEFRVKLDYSRYPLEVERIGLEILPLSSGDNVFLVPDLDAYKLITSTLLPGLDRDVFVQGWTLTESLFAFKYPHATTNFGFNGNYDQDVFPVLHYKIGLKRIFVDAFISNLTPLIVVLIVLFALLMLEKNIDIGKALSICVAVFFVVVFSHLDIRKNIGSGEIFYLEYFFFIVYLAIILVPINTLRLTMGRNVPLLDFHNGVVLKVSYWPAVLMVFFTITAYKFY